MVCEYKLFSCVGNGTTENTHTRMHTHTYCNIRVWAQFFTDLESNFLQWTCQNYSPLKLKRKMRTCGRNQCNII